jgi:BirA family transcriptional regulator, biotin operon repressor / biotin---[acetyl-CoA-carboxylase] ligase
MIPFMDGRIDPSRLKFIENVVVLPRIASTNALSRDVIEYLEGEEVEPVGTVFIALEQTEGRGRSTRRWVSPPGAGLYMTFLVPLPSDLPMTIIPIAAAVGVADGIRAGASCEVALKWPNDLLAAGGKLGGILTEARTQADRTLAAIGVGINLFETPGAWNDVAGATTVERTIGSKPSASRICQAIVEEVDGLFAVRGWEHVEERWQSLAIHKPGDFLKVRVGEAEVSGRYCGIDSRGFLRLETDKGETRIVAGEVTQW